MRISIVINLLTKITTTPTNSMFAHFPFLFHDRFFFSACSRLDARSSLFVSRAHTHSLESIYIFCTFGFSNAILFPAEAEPMLSGPFNRFYFVQFFCIYIDSFSHFVWQMDTIKQNWNCSRKSKVKNSLASFRPDRLKVKRN